MNPDEITRIVDVPVSPDRAWAFFVHRFAEWWPRAHCFCGEANLDTLFIDTQAGLWGEVTRTGERTAWGTARSAEPGRALSLGWQMDATVSPWVPETDPARASLIDISFDARGAGTRVTLRHHGFSRQGEPHAQAMRDAMIGLNRWHAWLALFRLFTTQGK